VYARSPPTEAWTSAGTPQALVGAVFAGVAAYLSVRFLVRYFETKTPLPFAIYSLAFGLISAVGFA
jgi:undecaprenyl-diphosphatase